MITSDDEGKFVKDSRYYTDKGVKVVMSAIRFTHPNGMDRVFYGVRHPHVYWQPEVQELLDKYRGELTVVEGFCTNELICVDGKPTYRFVDRKEGKRIILNEVPRRYFTVEERINELKLRLSAIEVAITTNKGSGEYKIERMAIHEELDRLRTAYKGDDLFSECFC